MIDVKHTTPSGLVVEIRVRANPDDINRCDWYVFATDGRVPGFRIGDAIREGSEDFRDDVLAIAMEAANDIEHTIGE